MKNYLTRFLKKKRRLPFIELFYPDDLLIPKIATVKTDNQKKLRTSFSSIIPSVIIVFLFLFSFKSDAYGQKITLKKSKVSLESILKDFEAQTSFVFFYKKEEIEPIKNITLDIKDASMFDALNTVFKGLDIDYDVFEKTIALKKVIRASPEVVDKRKVKTVTQLKGQVVDENELPLSGIQLRETSLNTRAISDDLGRFSIVGKAQGSLEVTGEGFSKQLVLYKDTNSLYIVMEKGKTTIIELQDVSIKSDNHLSNPTKYVDLTNRGYMNLSQVLQGTIPGLSLQTVNTSSKKITSIDVWFTNLNGQSYRKFLRMSVEEYLNFFGKQKGQATIDNLLKGNTDPLIKLNTITTISNALVPQIRGANNFIAENSTMLVVIDGFPQDGFPANYPMINVESIEVVKDPKELIKWGPKAAGGLILIKTKAAKKGKISVDYTSNFYYSAAPKFDRQKLMLASPAQYLDYARQTDSIFRPDLNTNTFNLSPAQQLLLQKRTNLITLSQFNKKWDSLSRMDNQDQLAMLTQDRFSQNHSLNLNGGSDAYKFAFNGNYTIDRGNELNSKTNNLSFTLNNDFNLLKNKLHMRLLINLSDDRTRAGYSFSPITTTLEPYQMLLDEQGNYVMDYTRISAAANKTITNFGYKDHGVNFLQDARANNSTTSSLSKKANFSLNWDLLPGLKWGASVFYTSRDNGSKILYGKESSYTRQMVNQYGELNGSSVNFYVPYGDILQRYNTDYEEYNLRSSLSYSKVFGKHALSMSIGAGAASISSSRPLNSTLYGYNATKDTGTPIYLPTPNTKALITNFYSLFPGSISSVSPYQISQPNTGDTSRTRNLNANLSLAYNFADRFSANFSYNAVLNPLYGQLKNYSTLENYNGEVTGTVVKNWGKAIKGIYLSTGITTIKMPDLPVNYNNLRYQQTAFNNFAIWVTGLEPKQQKGQSSTNIYERLTIALLDSNITVNAAFNSQKTSGTLQSLVGVNQSTSDEVRQNYLSAGIAMSLRKRLLNLKFDYSKSPEGITQFNGTFDYDIAKEKYFYSNTINALSLNAILQNISPYQGLGIMMGTNLSNNGSFSQANVSDFSALPPRNVNWEIHGKIAIMEDRYLFDLRYYNQTSSGINNFISVANDPATGLASKTTYSSLNNKGIEFFFTTELAKSNNFSYKVTLNGAHNRNVVRSVPENGFTATDSYLRAYRNGYDASNLWTLPWAGLNANGDPQYYDQAGNISTKLDSASIASAIVYAGVTKAPWTGGFIQDVRYKSFFARAAIVFNLGSVMRYYIPYPGYGVEKSALIANRWIKPGDEAFTDVPRLVQDGSNSYRQFISQFASNSIISADNIRLQEVMLGFNVPNKIIKKYGLSSLVLTCSVQNVIGWFRNKYNIDPVSVGNDGRQGLRTPRIYSANVSLSF